MLVVACIAVALTAVTTLLATPIGTAEAESDARDIAAEFDALRDIKVMLKVYFQTGFIHAYVKTKLSAWFYFVTRAISHARSHLIITVLNLSFSFL